MSSIAGHRFSAALPPALSPSFVAPPAVQYDNALSYEKGEVAEQPSMMACPCEACLATPPRLAPQPLPVLAAPRALFPPGRGHPTPLALDRPLALAEWYPNVKYRGAEAFYRAAPRNEHYFWYASKNLCLLLSTTQRSGASGKFRIGFDGSDRDYGVKEFRLRPKPGVDRNGYPKTFATPTAVIYKEACTTEFLRRGIEGSTRYLDRSDASLSWAKFRTETDYFEVFDLAVCEAKQKAYLVGPRDMGSLCELQEHLTPALNSALALSAAVQLFAEAGALHAVLNYAHLDISAGNVFYNPKGRLRLMDFGNAQPLVDGLSTSYGLQGTLAAPEMVLGGALGAATDAFTLGLLIFSLAAHAHDSGSNPFLIPAAQTVGGLARRERLLRCTFDQFWAWKARHAGQNNLVAASEIVAFADVHNAMGKTDPFTLFFLPLTQTTPGLSELLLNNILLKRPSQRASTLGFSQLLLTLTCSPKDTYNQPALREVMAHSDPLLQKPHLVRGLKLFRAMQPASAWFTPLEPAADASALAQAFVK